MDYHDLIVAPGWGEKAFAQIENNRYVFRVHNDATKVQVRKAVEKIFGVTVLKVNTATVKAKPKRRGAFKGTRPGYKRAIVTLRDGDSIQIFEGVR